MLLVSRSGFGFCRGVCPDEGNVHKVFGDKPNLKLVGADDFAHEEVVCAVVAGFGGLLGHRASFLQKNFVGFEETRDLDRNFFAATRRAGNDAGFSDVCGHGEAYAAEKLDALRDGVHEFVLLFVVLIKEKMKLVESVAGDLPMVLFVEIAEGDGVREYLIQVFDARSADVFVERNGKLGDLSERLNFAGVLVQDRAGTFGAGLGTARGRFPGDGVRLGCEG